MAMSSHSLDLSVLNLGSPYKRPLHSARFTFDTDLACGSSVSSSPRGSPPWTGSSRLLEDDDVFEEHRAAIPFKWEEIPGTPRWAARANVKEESSSSEQEDSSGISRSCSSSSSKSSAGSSDKTDSAFQFSPTEISSPTMNASKAADELISKAQIRPLKPPPRMQSIKQLLTLETTEDRNTSSRSLTSLVNSTTARRSFRRDGLKALPFLTSPRKEHNEYFMTTMLGFEEWGKVNNESSQEHHRSSSMSLSFRKKPVEKEKDSDAIFDEDFGKKGGLRERRPLSSISSRGLADGYNFKNKSWAYDTYVDDSDYELDEKSEYFDSTFVIPEDPETDQAQMMTDSESVLELSECAVEKKKKHGLKKLTRFFRSASSKPSRLSSVSPAPLPLLATTQTDLKLKRASQFQNQQGSSTSPLMKMCLSNPLGQALMRNVKQLRSFEFHSSRYVMEK